jgi:hypothetical protein
VPTGGPLVVQWRSIELAPFQAGAMHTVTVEAENAGSASWRSAGPDDGVFLAYHWLDERGNAIVWDGFRTPFERVIEPGATVRQEMVVQGPIPPGRYRLAVDLVVEQRFWLTELGNDALERDVDVAPRDATGARTFLADGAELADGWEERARALHEEGFGAVGGAIELRRAPEELRPYSPGGGRHPRFPHPLVCPSLLPPLEPNDEVAGLPAYRPDPDEPWMFDARLVIRLRSRSGRRRA